MQINVEIKNAKEIANLMAAMPEVINSELQKAVTKSAFLIEGESKKVTPVDTGRLRASILVENVSSSIAKISPHTDYAYTVHEGLGKGRNSRARPFMRWGVTASQDNIDKVFEDAVSNALKRLK